MTLLISISGIDGSGKSVFARRLSRTLEANQLRACLLHIDDDRRAVDWDQGDREEVDIYYRDYFDLTQTEARIQSALQSGLYDVVLIEGIFVHRLSANESALKVYLEVPFEVARSRIEARDIEKGRTLEEVQRRITRRYFPAQRRYLEQHQPARVADVLIDNSDYSAPRCLTSDPSSWPPMLRGSLLAILRSTSPLLQ